MRALWEAVKRGYLRLAEPAADWLVRRGVSPNEITTLGTFCVVATGVVFALGHIRTGAWILATTAVFDVLDGMVARRTGTATTFGAFYDSTLDRVADGALLGGLLVFYASDPVHHSTVMVVVALLGIIGAFLTSYTRARAESLDIDAKIGLIQRGERVTLLAAPQAIFGITLHGRVLMGIVVLLTVASWITVVQRMAFVYHATTPHALFVETRSVEWSGSFIFALLWLSFVLSIGAITLFHMMIRRGAAAKVASLFYLTPAVTALLAWLMFGETLSWTAIGGMVLASAGVALVTRG